MQRDSMHWSLVTHSLLLTLWHTLVEGLHSCGLPWWSQPGAGKGQHSENLDPDLPIVLYYLLPEILSCASCSFYTPTWALRDVSWLHRLSAEMRLLTLSWYWRARTQRDDILLGSCLCPFISTCFQHFQAPDAATAGHDGSQLRKSDPFQNVKPTRHQVQCWAFRVNPRDVCSTRSKMQGPKGAKSSWLCEKSTNTHRRKSAVSDVPMNNGFMWQRLCDACRYNIYHHADTEDCGVIACNLGSTLIITMPDKCCEHLWTISKTKVLQTFRNGCSAFGNILKCCIAAESPHTFLNNPEAL